MNSSISVTHLILESENHPNMPPVESIRSMHSQRIQVSLI